MTDVPTPDEIINAGKPKVQVVDGRIPLTPDQQKAIKLIIGGTAFVCIGVVPTLGDRGNPGSDFFVAIGGDPAHLRDARSSLPDVIERQFNKRGIV
jgi:hypothetical protein